ncbi:lantibiotic dehydratase [Streptomyces sp. NPDC101227]|uniref:lantibiotic dehydratase n=1 Tax=Streptomyces sp. NPDC101227 TaxID=3366136 RepID=UPI0037F43A22
MRLYRHMDVALVRAVACPEGRQLPPWPDLGDGAGVAQWRDWLREVWARDGVAEAVEVASPALARRVRAVCEGKVQQTRRVRRAVESLVRYLLRMEHRATPFGLFAGIAPAAVGEGPRVRWGPDHLAVVRADSVWLADVVGRLEASRELLHRLPAVADPTAVVRGGKLVVPCQQPRHDAGVGATEVSMRHTPAVAAVLRAARTPAVLGEVADELAAEYPKVPAEVIDGLLAELVARRVLLTALRAPMTVSDALGHLLGRLADADAGAIGDVADTVAELREIHAGIERHNRAAPRDRAGIRAAVAARMTALSDAVEQPLFVDLKLDCAVRLPREVAAEAERAATALARLSPFPSGSVAWQEYHTAFLERYGIGALVPVSELTDPDAGLGFPAGYQGSLLRRPDAAPSAREERLLALAQRAVFDGAVEIVLDDRMLDALAPAEPVRVPAHAELYLQLRATDQQALARGDFQLAVGNMSPAAGSTAGRFLHLFDEADRERLSAAYAAVPTLEPDAQPAQVSSPPLLVRTENLGRAPAVLPLVIPLAEHGDGERALPLADLAVGGDHHRLYVVSLSTGRIVEPTVLNSVEFTLFTHPLARFLCEVPRARAAALAPFVWGAARHLPFLPRVRYGRTVLAAARWTLEAADLAGSEAAEEVWDKSLADWRRRFRLPEAVYLGGDDRRLRLDLAERAHRQLLRAELTRDGQATLHEAPEPGAFGWLGGRANEISMPLAARQERRLPPTPQRPSPAVATGREDGHLPGVGEWAYLKLYGHPARHAEILTAHLPRLWEGWEAPPEWWFVGYRDPRPHLRLRFRVPGDAAAGGVWGRVGAWAAELRRLGLVSQVQWDTYFPETGRYGRGAAMVAAESVFAADAAAVVAQWRLTAGRGGPRARAVTAASLVDLAVSLAGDTEGGMRRLVGYIPKGPGPAPDRALHDETLRLAHPDDGFAAVGALPGGAETVEAWHSRGAALAVYRERLTDGGGREPLHVLPSLLHMHHVRAAGLDEDAERACLRLARAAALSWIARREAGA